MENNQGGFPQHPQYDQVPAQPGVVPGQDGNLYMQSQPQYPQYAQYPQQPQYAPYPAQPGAFSDPCGNPYMMLKDTTPDRTLGGISFALGFISLIGLFFPILAALPAIPGMIIGIIGLIKKKYDTLCIMGVSLCVIFIVFALYFYLFGFPSELLQSSDDVQELFRIVNR